MHKIMPNMQAAHGSDIEMYSQVYIYHVLGNKILPFNEKGISHVRIINKNHISSNIVSKPGSCNMHIFSSSPSSSMSSCVQ